MRGARLSEMYEQCVEVAETLCVLAVIGLGVWEISADRMTPGQLLAFAAFAAFAAFVGYFYPSVRSLGRLGLTLTAATAGAHRQERAGERAQPLVRVAVLEGVVLVVAERPAVDDRAQCLVRRGSAVRDRVAEVVVVAGEVVTERGAYHLEQLVVAGTDERTRGGHVEKADAQGGTHASRLRSRH
ncbi:hypothetical protein GCM10010377_28180 [Streptomyces viridiviolaceus]|nr:hypothetical protein GCM10010377_28180 [Streptomyces viridiviolaceus]